MVKRFIIHENIFARSEIPRLSLRGLRSKPKQSQYGLGTGSAILRLLRYARNDRKYLFIDEKGSVLLIALVIMTILTFLGYSSINTTSTEQTLAGNERIASVSFYTAEAGVQDGLARMVASFPALPAEYLVENGPLAGRYSVKYSYLSSIMIRGYSMEQYQGYEYEIYSSALSDPGNSSSDSLNEMMLDVIWFMENPNPKE